MHGLVVTVILESNDRCTRRTVAWNQIPLFMLIYQGIFEYRRVAQLWTNARVGLADWGYSLIRSTLNDFSTAAYYRSRRAYENLGIPTAVLASSNSCSMPSSKQAS